MTLAPEHLGGSGADDDASVAVVVGLAPESLIGSFNRAGVLAPADVHVARCLARLEGVSDETVLLGAALAVRTPHVGHVYVDLNTIREVATPGEESEGDFESLAWPDPGTWVSAMAASPLVSCEPDVDLDRPLVLSDSALYLNRLWQDEVGVAAALEARARFEPDPSETEDVVAALDRLFTDARSDEQRQAAVTTIGRRIAVIAGGPGTGKTTTVARLLAAVFDQAHRRGTLPPLVALAAPTGKAAARLAEAVRSETAALDLEDPVRRQLEALQASTVHRLLGPIPNVSTRFRHHKRNHLPHDIVIVDETSMLPLWLMARLTAAVRDDARLLLVGDPEQLTSVEAGVVLADIVGPAGLPHPAVGEKHPG